MDNSGEQNRIHVLGVGSIGKFLAHSIKSAPNSPPISLIFHRPIYLSGLRGPKCSLNITENGYERESGPYDVELSLPQRPVLREDAAKAHLPTDRESVEAQYREFVSDKPIRHLIVTVKSWQLKSALETVKHRLRPDSTVMLCMNGMGHMDEVMTHIWPESEAKKRPNFMECVNSHGVLGKSPYAAEHTGHGVIYVAVLPPSQIKGTPRHFDSSAPVPDTSLHLMRTVSRVPVLAAAPVTSSSLHERALEKLAVNCVINPLTALFDCLNGGILHSDSIRRSIRMLLAEISLVFRSLPELKGSANLDITFSPARLEHAVDKVAHATRANMSSMLVDVRKGQYTEIDALNGYVVRRGEEVGIKPVMNYLIMQMVLGKMSLVRRENRGFVYQPDLTDVAKDANPKL